MAVCEEPRPAKWNNGSCYVDTLSFLLAVMNSLSDFYKPLWSLEYEQRFELPAFATDMLRLADLVLEASREGLEPSSKNAHGQALDRLRDDFRLTYGGHPNMPGYGLQDDLEDYASVADMVAFMTEPRAEHERLGAAVVAGYMGRMLDVDFSCACGFARTYDTLAFAFYGIPFILDVQLDETRTLAACIADRFADPALCLPADTCNAMASDYKHRHYQHVGGECAQAASVQHAVKISTRPPFLVLNVGREERPGRRNVTTAREMDLEELDLGDSGVFDLLGVAYLYGTSIKHSVAEARWGGRIGYYDSNARRALVRWYPDWLFGAESRRRDNQGHEITQLVYVRRVPEPPAAAEAAGDA